MIIPPDQEISPEEFEEHLRRLVLLWAACCTSPILYLGAAALIRATIMPEKGWFPMEPFTWSRVMMGLVVLLILLQVLHIAVKLRARQRLRELREDLTAFFRLLARRTFILICLSEAAVATGFCLFLLQGDYKPVFVSGIAAMLLYGQSHPKMAWPE